MARKSKRSSDETVVLDSAEIKSASKSTGRRSSANAGKSKSGRSSSKSSGSKGTKKGSRSAKSSSGTSKNKKNKSTSKSAKKQANANKKSARANLTPEEIENRGKVHSEVASFVMLAIGVFLILAVQTSLVGPLGDIVGSFFKGMFGLGGVILPYVLIAYALLRFVKITAPFGGGTLIWIIMLFLSIDLINAARFVPHMKYGILGIGNVYTESAALESGGVFGMYVGSGIHALIGSVGLYIFAIVLAIVSLMLMINTPISTFFKIAKERKSIRKERKAEKLRLAEEEERRRAEERAEYAAKRLAVEEAGRESDEFYNSPSEMAGRFTNIYPYDGEGSEKLEMSEGKRSDKKQKKKSFFSRKQSADEIPFSEEDIELTPRTRMFKSAGADISPRLNVKELSSLSDNQKNILELMNHDSTMFAGSENPAFGGETQEERNARYEDPEELFKDLEQQDEINKKEREEQKKAEDAIDIDKALAGGALAAAAGMTIDGASNATKRSETESSDTDVKVTAKKKNYKFPPITLLDPKKSFSKAGETKTALREKAILLEETLKSFNVEAHVTNVISGPSVTRYEIEPARGVKVSSITKLADDIALNMRAKSIRIEAPIPGKAAVGIEIENKNRQMVGMKEMIDSSEFKNHKSKLAFTVGRDIGGNAVVADLGKMPHMLIAGATGSGKSVCINSIIISILYKANPDEVKLVLVDPKMVELGNYNGIPHLLIPVVTDPTKAAGALQWAVSEMTDRYKKFAKTGVKNIAGYNQKMKAQGETDEILSQIVIIIDELADLMMVASSQVEDAIVRLAQLARAAGMHLILATQRPSVDVITGLIKANVPSRIAFMVSSQVDSRTIIDKAGAEKLVGNGDMLFKPQDLNEAKRIQGPFVSEDEVDRVIEFVKTNCGEAEYNKEVEEHIEHSGASGGADSEDDELMMDALEVVVDQGSASTSMLQRRFRIGYNRAARIIDTMEDRGFVGKPDGSKGRPILISQEEFERIKKEYR